MMEKITLVRQKMKMRWLVAQISKRANIICLFISIFTTVFENNSTKVLLKHKALIHQSFLQKPDPQETRKKLFEYLGYERCFTRIEFY